MVSYKNLNVEPGGARHHLDKRAADLAAAGAGDADDLLTTSKTAEWLKVSVQWLEIGRHKGYGPPFKRLSPSQIRYKRADVLGWLEERSFRATSEYMTRQSGDGRARPDRDAPEGG